MFEIVVALCLFAPFASSSYYNIDTTSLSTYTWKGAYPQSCECMENGVTKSKCELFRCTCACDVTAQVCDYDCCCDPDCSTDQITRFSALNTCAFEGFEPDSVTMCYNSHELVKVNQRQNHQSQSTAQQAVQNALCIDKRNYAFKSDYYNNVAVQDSSIFASSAATKEYNYYHGDSSLQTLVDSNYDQNDTISSFQYNSITSTMLSRGIGQLSLPNADFSGNCNDNNYVTFENKQALSSCRRHFADTADLAVQCTNQLSLSGYVTERWVAQNANLQAAGAASLSNTVQVQLESLSFVDYSTGSSTSVSPASWASNSCKTTAFASLQDYFNNSSPGCSWSSTAVQVARNMSGQDVTICANAVRSVRYTITHDATAAGAITSVRAAVSITDIPMIMISAGAGVDYSQSFGVSFESHYAAGVSEIAGNQVLRARSGNPGYLHGAPIVFGQAATSGAAVVREVIGGLQVPVASVLSTMSGLQAGQCPYAGAAQVAGFQAIKFGYDMSTGCVLQLNRAELAEFCCQGSQSCTSSSSSSSALPREYITASGVPLFFNISSGLVGIFGNADPLDQQQWLNFDYSVSSANRVWTDNSGTCSNMYSGINIIFLTAQSGEKLNPQSKIVGVTATTSTSSWVMRTDPVDNTTRQNFALSMTVSFIPITSQTLVGYAPPAPPVLFKVPYDVFYPFASAASDQGQATGRLYAFGFAVTLSIFLTLIYS